jgi:DNA polymerase-3 subunit beta
MKKDEAMKISIAKGELLRGLGRIQSIVEKRNTMPILAHVHIDARKDAKDGIIELAATDLEVGIRSIHPADVKKPGRVTASAKKLYEILRELPDEPVQLEATPNAYLALRCARAAFDLAGNAAEEYPELPVLTPGETVSVPAPLLGQMIERTMYAASADETRYNLNGVFVEYLAETGKLRMVATDGHRLAHVDRPLGVALEGIGRGVIIPRKGLSELKRLVDEEDADEIELGFEGNNALVRKRGVTLSMRLIEGEFPNYRQVIPKPGKHQIVMPTEAIVQALRRVIIVAAERSRAVKFELGAGLLRLSSNNPDLGEAREEIDVDYMGEELAVAFNARYLLDALSFLGAKEVRLGFQDAVSPATIAPADDADSLAVVMPMRL